MATIRAQLAELRSAPDIKTASLNFSESIKDLDIDLFGYIYSIVNVLFINTDIDENYFSLRVVKYVDIDEITKFAIGISFLPITSDYSREKSDSITDNLLKILKDEIIDLKLNYIFNDITLNDKQWRNNVE